MNSCPFPAESDANKVDHGLATIQIVVRPDGTVLSATILRDSGHGFGRAAQLCLTGRRYRPALDQSGTPIIATTPVNVHFDRLPPVNER